MSSIPSVVTQCRGVLWPPCQLWVPNPGRRVPTPWGGDVGLARGGRGARRAGQSPGKPREGSGCC